METLKKNYEGDWIRIFENKKFGPYPVPVGVVVPTHTLPGGRCISFDSRHLCKIGTSEFSISTQELYDLYSNNNVQILSHYGKDKKATFAPINHIWASGEKIIYRVETQQGFSTQTSGEHLFFVNGKYIPLFMAKKGDQLTCSDNKNIINDKIKSIKEKRTKELTYDMEVPSTENLFSDNIKCHNSRWFRYLFQSGI